MEEKMYDPSRVSQMRRLPGHPFRIGKLGHVVLNVRDVERSARFYTELLGFEVSDVYPLAEGVRAHDHLRRHGVEIDFAGRRRAGCQIAVEFRDPDNHRLEIYWGIDQIGSDGHVRPPSEWKGARNLADAIGDPVRGQDTSLHDPSLIERHR
jgi:hypothetical protein